MIPILGKDPESPFPPTGNALDYPPGLLAAGGDLHPVRLISAYRLGIFPWYSEGQPILWWSPAPRCVIFPSLVHVSRRLRRVHNQGRFKLTIDQAFGDVIESCAGPRPGQNGTWITAEMQSAYIKLHELGVAHSLEVWADDDLAGGIYGLSLGQVFFGESMFSRTRDASKVALVALCKHLQRRGFSLLDCQVSNAHLQSMGAVEISRSRFEKHLPKTAEPTRWDTGLEVAERW